MHPLPSQVAEWEAPGAAEVSKEGASATVRPDAGKGIWASIKAAFGSCRAVPGCGGFYLVESQERPPDRE